MIIELLEYIAKIILNSITVAIILGALIAGYFGFHSYKKQKDREGINKRYFENGIENLINYLNELRIKTENNYVNALIAANFYRDLKKEDFKNWLQKSKLRNERVLSSMPNSFLITIGMFEDNKDLGDLCIDIFIECGATNEFYFSELPLMFNKYIEDPNLKNDNAENLRKIIVEKHEKVIKKQIYKVIENLEKILFRLREMNIDSYKKLKNARNDKAIKEILMDFKK